MPCISQNGTTAVSRVPYASGLLALAPTTVFQLPGRKRESFSRLAEAVRQVPCYRLDLGADRSRIPGVITELLNGQEA